MSRAHFHPVQSLLASIDGELCGLLKQVNEEANDDSQTFDKKWITHLHRIAELATMHFDIYKHYSNHLITMRAFRDMCSSVMITVSKFGIPKIDTPSSPNGSQNDHILKDIFESASTVWNYDKSYDINEYDKARPFFKRSLQNAVTDRIEFCKKTIEWINWYIQTLQTLISNFDALGKTKKIPTMVEKILKPGCVIFHITESDPLSTVQSLVQRARELLHMKEHPHAFDAHVQTMAIEMMRESERVKRRTDVHEMMADAYASKPTLSQKQQFKMQSASGMYPDFHPKVLSLAANGPYILGNIGRPSYGSFGEAMAQAEARAEEAKRVAAAKRRSDVHKMMAAAYASNPTLSQKTQFKMQSASEMRPDFHPKFRSFAAWNVANPYDYGTYTPFGEALEEAEAMAIADAEEAEAVRLAFVKPKPKTKRCSMMGGRIKRKSKKRNSR